MQKRVPTAVGVRLQETRELAGLAARELDRLVDTTEGHASLIESGVVRNVTLETASKLAGVLGVSLDWLVRGTGRAPSARSVRQAVELARGTPAVGESGEHPAVDASRSEAG
jgi:transcriptional regulator with XRE-family HTH domain